MQRPPRVIVTASPYGSLTHALECARIVAPLDHISIVVPARDAAHARIEVEWYDGIRMFVHVREQGTPDVLVPLAHAFAEDPLGSVVILPSEFCIAEPHVTAGAVRRALGRRTVTVIGLGDSGSFVTVAPVTVLWDVLREARPLHAAVFENYLEAIESGDEGTLLVAAYQHLPPIDFVADVVIWRNVEKVSLPPCSMRTNLAAVLSRARLRSRPTSAPLALRPSTPDQTSRMPRSRDCESGSMPGRAHRSGA